MAQRTALYRHFDADGRLLYVGISLSAIHRLSQHMAASSWADEIVSVTIVRFETREEAHAAEREAIRAEAPVHNLLRYAVKLETVNATDGEHDVEAVLDNDEAGIERDIERARYELMRATVTYRPVYTVDQAADATQLNAADIMHWMVNGECGYVVLRKSIRNYPTEGGTPHLYRKLGMTGWQLIDLIEIMQRQSQTGVQILSERPQGAPKASLLREPLTQDRGLAPRAVRA